MEEILTVIFAILVFAGPVLFKIVGSIFEHLTSPAPNRAPSPPPEQSDFAEKLREHRKRKFGEDHPVEAEIVEVASPIRSLSNSNLDEQDAYYNQSQHLADAVQLRGDQLDAHLHDAFDHTLGSLGSLSASPLREDLDDSSESPPAPAENLAASIAAMMNSPTEIRKAFILGEILQRPAAMDRS